MGTVVFRGAIKRRLGRPISLVMSSLSLPPSFYLSASLSADRAYWGQIGLGASLWQQGVSRKRLHQALHQELWSTFSLWDSAPNILEQETTGQASRGEREKGGGYCIRPIKSVCAQIIPLLLVKYQSPVRPTEIRLSPTSLSLYICLLVQGLVIYSLHCEFTSCYRSRD